MVKPVIVLGGGGHARVLIDALIGMGVSVLGITEKSVKPGVSIAGIPVIGPDSEVLGYPIDQVYLVNGLGSTGNMEKRINLFKTFKEHGYTFYNVINPSAVMASGVKLGEGVQVMAGAVIQTGSSIGCNSIINTRSSVDHDCVIGDHVHIAPGVTLSGSVKIGQAVHVGTGASIIQGISIGENSIIGAGSVVLEDLPSCVTAFGIPARVVK